MRAPQDARCRHGDEGMSHAQRDHDDSDAAPQRPDPAQQMRSRRRREPASACYRRGTTDQRRGSANPDCGIARNEANGLHHVSPTSRVPR